MIERFDFTDMSVCSDEGARPAADILASEICDRTGKEPPRHQTEGEACVRLVLFYAGELSGKDCFRISLDGRTLTIGAMSLRGLIYGIGLFFRRTEYRGGVTLVGDITGDHKPRMSIRGHQLGLRACSNTYDAWDGEQYRRYCLDMMYFGANMCELIPEAEESELMKKSPDEMLPVCIGVAKSLGLDVSLWWPNDKLSADESAEKRKRIIQTLPDVDVIFIPGSDPGDYPADELIERVCKIERAVSQVSDAKVWVSAQAPHDSPNWGDDFIRALEAEPCEISGVIMGPNHAMPLDELRKRVPDRYPIRFYPDITHNVRCEYPVHNDRDDWHFSLAGVNGRESTNPRPREFAALHRKTAGYLEGSCSYSEGVNDDVNKMLWSAMDYQPGIGVRQVLCDYSRLFFPQVDAELMADAILLLEDNWNCDSAENPVIEHTYSIFCRALREAPSLGENWRFNSLLFRACCDMISRRRRLFELELIAQARILCEKGQLVNAYGTLNKPFPEDYCVLRKQADELAAKLFDQIGMQLGTERYHASEWERGAVLDSIDLPISDRQWLKGRLELAMKMPQSSGVDFAVSCFGRCDAAEGEVYYSVALHGLPALGVQQKREVYLSFKGDSPKENDGSLPSCLLNVFDSWCFSARFSGVAEGELVLRVTYTDNPKRKVDHHKVMVNGTVLYDGPGYGGRQDKDFDRDFLPDGFVTASYDIPEGCAANGCIELEISEPTVGFELAELRIKRKSFAGR